MRDLYTKDIRNNKDLVVEGDVGEKTRLSKQ
jgi:hypothetical protein